MFVPEFPEHSQIKCNMLAATARCQGCGQQYDTSVPFDMASYVRDCSTQTDVVVYHDILPAGVDLAREGGGPGNSRKTAGPRVPNDIYLYDSCVDRQFEIMRKPLGVCVRYIVST